MTHLLQTAQHAWERGDYAQTRKLAQKILESEKDANARRLAEELLARTRYDKAAVVLGLIGVILFVIVFVSYAGRT